MTHPSRRTRRDSFRWCRGLALAAGLASASASLPSGQPAGEPPASSAAASAETLSKRFAEVDGYFPTIPSKDAQMGFQVSTQVLEVLVKGGDKVKADQVLVRGDDEEELALLKIQEIRAKTTLPVDRARRALDLAKIELERAEQSFEGGGAMDLEVERAKANAAVAAIDLDTAIWNMDQEVLQLDRMKKRAERFLLRAPFEGQVDVVAVDRGDVIRETEPVLRLVQIDPLWVDVNTPVTMSVSKGLKNGDKAWVLLDVPGAPKVIEGKIIEVSPVANFAARKQRVRVEFDNPSGWPPGLAAWIRFTQPSEEWNDLLVKPESALASEGM